MNAPSLIATLSEWLGQLPVILGICLIIVVFALIVSVNVTARSRRIRKDARAARGLITGTPEATGVTAAEAASPVGRRVFDAIASAIDFGGRKFIRTSSADLLAGVLDEYYDVGGEAAVPNVFVGVGLLLTFAGLTISLLSASIGAASGDVTVVKQSVTTLLTLSAAKFAFSLVALLCSLFLGWHIRRSRYASERALQLLVDDVRRAFPVLSTEDIAVHGLSEAYLTERDRSQASAFIATLFDSGPVRLMQQHIEDLLAESKEQTSQLQSFNSGLAIQLGEALDNRVRPMIEKLGDRLEETLLRIGVAFEQGGKTNEDGLRSLLESFIGELRSATSTDASALQDSTQQLASDLSRTSAELSNRMESLFSGFEAVAQRFGDVLGNASSGFRDEVSRVQTDVAATLADAAKALVETTAQSRRDSEAMFSQIGAGASSFRESIENGAAAFAGELGRGSRSIDDTIERLSNSVGRLQAVVDHAEAFAKSSSEQTGQRIVALNDTLSAVDSGFRRVGEASQPFATAAGQVRSVLELLHAAEISVQAKVTSLQTAAQAILASSEALTTSVGNNVDKLTGGLETSSEALTDAVRSIASEAQSAGAGLSETIQQTLREYEARFSGVDRELQTSLEKIIATFQETYEEMRTRIKDVDSQMASTVNKLVTFNDGFEEHLDELTDVVSQLSKSMATR